MHAEHGASERSNMCAAGLFCHHLRGIVACQSMPRYPALETAPAANPRCPAALLTGAVRLEASWTSDNAATLAVAAAISVRRARTSAASVPTVMLSLAMRRLLRAALAGGGTE